MGRQARGRCWWKAPSISKIIKSGSPSRGWKIIEEWFESRGAAQEDIWLDKLEALRMQRRRGLLVWIKRVNDVGNPLACLEIHKTEAILRHRIVRHLSPGV